MNPIAALRADQEQYEADAEIRRYKRISAGRTTAAVTFPDHATRDSVTDDEQQALRDAWTRCIAPAKSGGLNRQYRTIFGRDDVEYWSREIPHLAFFYEDPGSGEITEFVGGEVRAS